MRKEIIVAILVGIIFGGIFTFGIRRANVALKPTTNNSASSPQATDDKEVDKNLPDGLSILAPEQNDVYIENTVTISGITKPKSTVVISSKDEDFIITSDDSGEFTQEIELSGGLNKVLISSFDGESTIGEEELNLVYTTEIDI